MAKHFSNIGGAPLLPPCKAARTLQYPPTFLTTPLPKDLWPDSEAMVYEAFPTLVMSITRNAASNGTEQYTCIYIHIYRLYTNVSSAGTRVIPTIASIETLYRNLRYDEKGCITHASAVLARTTGRAYLAGVHKVEDHKAVPLVIPSVFSGAPSSFAHPEPLPYADIVIKCGRAVTVFECKAICHEKHHNGSPIHPLGAYVMGNKHKPLCTQCYHHLFLTGNRLFIHVLDTVIILTCIYLQVIG